MKKLNQFIVVPLFKMETLFSIIAALQPQEWITKIDLKDAYHHILVHVNIRKYFRLVVAGTVYQFRVLPFGLSTAPREFTKTPGNLRINRFLPEYSPERIMQIDWLEIVQRIRTPLSSRHGSRYGTPGHPSGGRTDGFPVIWCPNYSSLPTSTNVG